MVPGNLLKTTLPSPALPSNLPPTAQWLAGEGAGSWFVIEQKTGANFWVGRFDPTGKSECAGVFQCSGNGCLDVHSAFVVTYLSHCQKVTVVQNNKTVILERV